MTIPQLVQHVRAWLPRAPKAYGRFLDLASTMSDEGIADVVRFAKTPHGAEMALVHHLKTKGY